MDIWSQKKGEAALVAIDRRFWRIMLADRATDVLAPARSPEGRSHHGGQVALYLSETPEGCVVAVRRYMTPSDGPRVICPLRVRADRIVDLRDPEACAALGIDVSMRAAEWQDWRARGEPAPTWAISDRVRALGLHGMLYASRSQPDLTHLTLFGWNAAGGAEVQPDGPPCPLTAGWPMA